VAGDTARPLVGTRRTPAGSARRLRERSGPPVRNDVGIWSDLGAPEIWGDLASAESCHGSVDVERKEEISPEPEADAVCPELFAVLG